MGFTADRWAELSEKEKWDIMVALRGPDSYYGETLKWYTTSVIRGQMRGIIRVGGTINSDLNLIVTPSDGGRSLFSKTKKERWNCRHFIEHVQLAAHHLQLPDLSIPADLWHEVMCTPSAYDAGNQIIKVLEKSESKSDTSKISELRRHLSMGRMFS